MAKEPGSVTQLLGLNDEDVSNEILVRVLDRYGALWDYVVNLLLPANKRRSGDVEDAIQESLLALHLELLKPGCPFRTGRDIRNWMSRVARNKGVNQLRANSRIEGPSSVPTPKKDGQATTELHANLGDAAAKTVWRDLTPDECQLERELLLQMEELDQHVDDVLTNWGSDLDRGVVRNYLKWVPYRAIMEEFSISSRAAQEITYDFITIATIVERVEEVRDGLFALAKSAPRDAAQCAPNCKCHRILIDHRSKP